MLVIKREMRIYFMHVVEREDISKKEGRKVGGR